jgi:hypothetical protein
LEDVVSEGGCDGREKESESDEREEVEEGPFEAGEKSHREERPRRGRLDLEGFAKESEEPDRTGDEEGAGGSTVDPTYL